ncbi:MAG: murein L,D-transpeptidase catalytic domain family protein [Bacteroidota bacterium]
MIRKIFTTIFSIVIVLGMSSFKGVESNTKKDPINPPSEVFNDYSLDLYNKLNDSDLSYEAFKTALKGYLKLHVEDQVANNDYLTIIDMSQSANEDRFYLIDLKNQEIITKSKVAHGRNSGNEYAKNFSNKIGSYQSSLGFFKTAETYHGKHGLSLRLDGLEHSNFNARKRAIVIHSADYVSENFISQTGRLGRSLGCPALPEEDFSKIIKLIKEGSILFIYYPEENYFERSNLAASININQLFTQNSSVSEAK